MSMNHSWSRCTCFLGIVVGTKNLQLHQLRFSETSGLRKPFTCPCARATIGSPDASVLVVIKQANNVIHARYARVMLLRKHGASKLGKALRRPIVTTMTSFNGILSLSWDAMKSTLAMFRGGRAL